MQETSDEQLMLAFAQHDQKAFEQLYTRHKDAVYRYYLRHINNEATAQELFQDLWLKIIKSKQSYKVTAQFKTWLYTLAHNRLVDWYRRNHQEKLAFKDQGNDITDVTVNWNPEDELQTLRLCAQLKSAIAELPFDQQEVFLLHQEALLSLGQISTILQTNIEKVKSRYRYAIKKLRVKLEHSR
ncbi:MAG TPA: sigma-70 family RNA polymerase sigma factor [Oceanospirillales bacterium]|nr:sigma-70 family RNA polymerase sigma factor [Oceanospirillales bacterium]